jgi:ribosomal peptide maturation radical SAM protein 1
MNYRAMSPDKAIQQFESLFKYAPRCTRYWCVDNILAKNYFSEVLPYLNPPADASIFYEVKADLSEEDVKILAEKRVNLIQPGVESINTSTLKLMKKGTSAFQNLILLKNCAMHNVFPVWNLLVGFPREGEEVYKKYVDDMPLLTHLPPPNGAAVVQFHRYSPYFTKALEYGLELQPLEYYQFIYPFSKESIENIAYYFEDTKFDAEYRIAITSWIARIQKGTNYWRSRYNHSAMPARLHFKESDGETVVYDSRSGQAVEHKISEAGLEILRACNKANRVAQLKAQLGHLPYFDAEKEVAYLQERGLLFQEHERLLSLVLPHQPGEHDRSQQLLH